MTDRPTDKVGCRVACTRLKIMTRIPQNYYVARHKIDVWLTATIDYSNLLMKLAQMVMVAFDSGVPKSSDRHTLWKKCKKFSKSVQQKKILNNFFLSLPLTYNKVRLFFIRVVSTYPGAGQTAAMYGTSCAEGAFDLWPEILRKGGEVKMNDVLKSWQNGDWVVVRDCLGPNAFII